jgi:hypothetical protein
MKRRIGGTVRLTLALPEPILSFVLGQSDPEGFVKRAMRWGVAHKWRPARQ